MVSKQFLLMLFEAKHSSSQLSAQILLYISFIAKTCFVASKGFSQVKMLAQAG